MIRSLHPVHSMTRTSPSFCCLRFQPGNAAAFIYRSWIILWPLDPSYCCFWCFLASAKVACLFNKGILFCYSVANASLHEKGTFCPCVNELIAVEVCVHSLCAVTWMTSSRFSGDPYRSFLLAVSAWLWWRDRWRTSIVLPLASRSTGNAQNWTLPAWCHGAGRGSGALRDASPDKAHFWREGWEEITDVFGSLAV